MFLKALFFFSVISVSRPEAVYDNLRYAPKGSQASPGLFFDPTTGTFRAKPPQAPIVRSIDEEVTNESIAFGGDDDKEYSEDNSFIPELSSRGAILAKKAREKVESTPTTRAVLRKQYTTIVRQPTKKILKSRRKRIRNPSRARKLTGFDRVSSRRSLTNRRSGEEADLSTKYRHFDDPSEVIVETRANKYLQEHSSKLTHSSHQNRLDSHKAKKKDGYDIVIGGDRRQPPSRRSNADAAGQKYEVTDILRKTATTTTAATTSTTVRSTTAFQFYPTVRNKPWTPTSEESRRFRVGSKKEKKKNTEKKSWKPMGDRKKILERFRKEYQELTSRNEVAQTYPKNENEKFPHFPAKDLSEMPHITRPTRRPGEASKNKDEKLATAGDLTPDLNQRSTRPTFDTGSYKKTSIEDSVHDMDSFSTHSTAQNTFVPFENSRLTRKPEPNRQVTSTSRQDLYGFDDSHEMKRSKKKRTEITAEDLISTDVSNPDWGKKIRENEDDDEKVDSESPKARGTNFYSKYDNYNKAYYGNGYEVTRGTTTLSTTTTTTTTTNAAPRHYPTMVESYNKHAETSPFSSVTQDHHQNRPGRFGQDQHRQDFRRPLQQHNYERPDVHEAPKPRRSQSIKNSAVMNYHNYFAYGAPTQATATTTKAATSTSTTVAPTKKVQPRQKAVSYMSFTTLPLPTQKPRFHQDVRSFRDEGPRRGQLQGRPQSLPQEYLDLLLASPTEKSAALQKPTRSFKPKKIQKPHKNLAAFNRQVLAERPNVQRPIKHAHYLGSRKPAVPDYPDYVEDYYDLLDYPELNIGNARPKRRQRKRPQRQRQRPSKASLNMAFHGNSKLPALNTHLSKDELYMEPRPQRLDEDQNGFFAPPSSKFPSFPTSFGKPFPSFSQMFRDREKQQQSYERNFLRRSG